MRVSSPEILTLRSLRLPLLFSAVNAFVGRLTAEGAEVFAEGLGGEPKSEG